MNRLRYVPFAAHLLAAFGFLAGAGFAFANSRPSGAAWSGLIAGLLLIGAWFYWRRIQNDGNGSMFKLRS